MKSISKKELSQLSNLKKYCELSGKINELDKARKEVQDNAFKESESYRKKHNLDKNEDLQLHAGKYNCIARINVTSKEYHIPKYLNIPFQKIEVRYKNWKKKVDQYIKKNPNKLKKSNRNIRVTVG